MNSTVRSIFNFFFLLNKVFAGPVNSARDPQETQNVAENSVLALSKRTLNHPTTYPITCDLLVKKNPSKIVRE